MIEKYFDKPILYLGKYEYDLNEQEDLVDWFNSEKPSIKDMSHRELTFYMSCQGKTV